MMAYPCGASGGRAPSAWSPPSSGLVAFSGGAVEVGHSCLRAPLVAMVAAALRLYPYGGPAPQGSAARIMQYAAPGLCLLIGLGVFPEARMDALEAAIGSVDATPRRAAGGRAARLSTGFAVPIGRIRPRPPGPSPGRSGRSGGGGRGRLPALGLRGRRLGFGPPGDRGLALQPGDLLAVEEGRRAEWARSRRPGRSGACSGSPRLRRPQGRRVAPRWPRTTA